MGDHAWCCAPPSRCSRRRVSTTALSSAPFQRRPQWGRPPRSVIRRRRRAVLLGHGQRPAERVRSAGARADVPDIEIMAQLARRAERIARTSRPAGARRRRPRLQPGARLPADDRVRLRRTSGSHSTRCGSGESAGTISPTTPPPAPTASPVPAWREDGRRRRCDWRTKPETQILSGVSPYIGARYRNPRRRGIT